MEQQLLPEFKKSERDLIDMALSLPLDRKIEKAVALLKDYESRALSMNVDGYYVCDSFGKDSGVIVHLAKLAGVAHKCHHNLTTIDPPELILFGKKHRSETIIHLPKKHLVLQRMVEKANPPTRLNRWCCQEYKEHGGDGSAKVIGVRIAESARRSGLWKVVNHNTKGGIIIAPIAYWTEEDVWAFHAMFSLPYCDLYDHGYKRLGCIGCPLSGTTGQKRDFQRWPAYERVWRKGFQKMWDRWHGIPNNKGEPRFFEKLGSADATFEWWISGDAYSEEENAQCVFEEMMSNV